MRTFTSITGTAATRLRLLKPQSVPHVFALRRRAVGWGVELCCKSQRYKEIIGRVRGALGRIVR